MDAAIQFSEFRTATVRASPAMSEGEGGPESAKTKLLLLDRRILNLECLATGLALKNPELSIRAHSSFADALAKGVALHPPGGIVLLSIGAASASEPEVAEDIGLMAEMLPGVPLLLISDREDLGSIVEALDQGVRGYIPTSIGISVILGAIQLVQAGGTFVPAGALASMTRREPASEPARTGALLANFTPRQAQVLTCLRHGKANKNIAYELNMCESTVKVHVRHIMKKLKATNRTQVAFLTNQFFGD